MSRILIVDDDWGAARGLRTLLEMDGFQAHAVGSSAEGLALLSQDGFDGLVADLEMPQHKGLEVIRAARTAHPGMHILGVTAYVESPTTRDALAFGAHRVFNKPLNYDLLLAELRAGLDGKD